MLGWIWQIIPIFVITTTIIIIVVVVVVVNAITTTDYSDAIKDAAWALYRVRVINSNTQS